MRSVQSGLPPAYRIRIEARNALDSRLETFAMITLFTGYDEEPKDKKKEQEAQAGEEESSQISGFFSRMRQAVTRTRETFSSRINEIVALTREVDESSLEELETALIMSDIGVQTTTEILDALRERARVQAIEGGDRTARPVEAATARNSRSPACAPSPNPPAAAQSHLPRRRKRNRQNNLRAASSPPGIARRTNPCSSAPQTPFALLPSSSSKSGPAAAASR